jgi:two-component system OmpR family response regulator
MPDRPNRVILDDDVFILTAKGQSELSGAATSLAPSALEVLVLIDGRSTVGETAARTRTIGKDAVADILDELMRDGLIEIAGDQAGALDFIDFFHSTGHVKPSAAATAKAKKETDATTALLQQQGYFVRIARRAKTREKPEAAGGLAVLVIEDETHLAKLLTHVLKSEGFSVRTAKDRAEIVADIRRGPRPDLVLLDVSLPDIDGFDVLLKMRQHPGLKTVPVVMLTAKATRDAVLKGLAGGADGYITKPFEIDVLIKAVNVVLGLSGEEPQAEAKQGQ